MKMSKKTENLIMFGISIMICFVLWTGILGGLHADGILNLDAVEIGDTFVKTNFLVMCLYPPVAFGYMLMDQFDLWRRSKNGIEKQDQ